MLLDPAAVFGKIETCVEIQTYLTIFKEWSFVGYIKKATNILKLFAFSSTRVAILDKTHQLLIFGI